MWRSVGKILPNRESLEVVKALKATYPDYKYQTISVAFSKLVSVVHSHIEECGELGPQEFFGKYKGEVFWAKNLRDDILSQLFKAIMTARINLKNLRLDLPVEGPYAAPAAAWKETCLTHAIDALHEGFIDGYSQSCSEVLWDWGLKDGEDTDIDDGANTDVNVREQKATSEDPDDDMVDDPMDNEDDHDMDAMEGLDLSSGLQSTPGGTMTLTFRVRGEE